MAKGGGSLIYSSSSFLYLQVVHVGEYGSGHYYAYVRPDVQRNKWYRFDDHKVTEVDFKEVTADSFGGHSERRKRVQKKGILARLFGGNNSFGWGGPKSSAYMLQYVRRCDVPKLYGSGD